MAAAPRTSLRPNDAIDRDQRQRARPPLKIARQQKEAVMTTNDILFIGLVLSAFVAFGITLAYASIASARLRHR